MRNKIILSAFLVLAFIPGIAKSDSRRWLTSNVDTYLSASAPGSSFYSSAAIGPYRDATLGVRQRALIWYRGILDSLQGAARIDSALLQVHYSSGAIGTGTIRLCRGIADSSWYNSSRATWNARYKNGNDSLSWAGGWGVHASSYTTDNSVTVNLADTNSTGWYQFSCKSLISDILADGVDWGFWLDNGSGSNSQRSYFDSAEDAGKDYPKLYIEYTRAGGGQSRRRRLLEE